MTTTPTKEICFDRETGDFRLTLDGKLVGYAASYSEGNVILDELAYAQLTHPQCGTPDAEPAHADAEAAEVPTVVVVAPSPLIEQVQHVAIDRVALEDAYHAAILRHPDATRGWGKAIKAAYEYLVDVWNDRGAVTFLGDVLLAESGSRPGVVHLANGACSCEAGKAATEAGREAICQHRARRQLVVRMREAKAWREDGERQLAGRLAAARAKVAV